MTEVIGSQFISVKNGLGGVGLFIIVLGGLEPQPAC